MSEQLLLLAAGLRSASNDVKLTPHRLAAAAPVTVARCSCAIRGAPVGATAGYARMSYRYVTDGLTKDWWSMVSGSWADTEAFD